MAVELLTVSAYARRRGCDEKAVRKAIAENRITAIDRDGKKLVDPDVADIQWTKNTRARAGSGKPAEGGAAGQDGPPAAAAAGQPQMPGDGEYLSYERARAMRENEEAMTARLNRQEREGKLTSSEDVGRAVWTAFRLLRDSAMPLGRRVSGVVAGMTDAREIQLLIDAEQRRVLNDFRDKVLAALAARHGAGQQPSEEGEGADAGR